mmetsp:Transcript_20881/g.68975  ORF Transcript_20881/g.68975 Transcript_20881/m.68975 type:complete len:260 (-) Transcript_20881:43-822(-)
MEAAGSASTGHKRFISAEGCYSHVAAHTAGLRIKVAARRERLMARPTSATRPRHVTTRPRRVHDAGRDQAVCRDGARERPDLRAAWDRLAVRAAAAGGGAGQPRRRVGARVLDSPRRRAHAAGRAGAAARLWLGVRRLDAGRAPDVRPAAQGRPLARPDPRERRLCGAAVGGEPDDRRARRVVPRGGLLPHAGVEEAVGERRRRERRCPRAAARRHSNRGDGHPRAAPVDCPQTERRGARGAGAWRDEKEKGGQTVIEI